MADDEFVIGFSDSEWTGIAPLLEEDVAMSSLAQDEIGHAAALYGLLGELTGADPDALAYDREPDDVPPRAPARPRPRRLGDDDRPALPVRDGRRGPPRGAGRRVVGAAGRARRQAPARGALPPDARRGLARPAGPDAAARRATGCVAALETLGPGRARRSSRHSPTKPALVEAGILAAPMRELEARWRAAIVADASRRSTCRCRRRPGAAPTAGPATATAFRWLWGEFTAVRRADPGATW